MIISECFYNFMNDFSIHSHWNAYDEIVTTKYMKISLYEFTHTLYRQYVIEMGKILDFVGYPAFKQPDIRQN